MRSVIPVSDSQLIQLVFAYQEPDCPKLVYTRRIRYSVLTGKVAGYEDGVLNHGIRSYTGRFSYTRRFYN